MEIVEKGKEKKHAQAEHISSLELAMSAKPCASGLAHMTAVDIANAFAL
jgi:hypothetical protein